MQRGARHVLRAGEPCEHSERAEFTFSDGLAEQDARGLVADAQIDADIAIVGLDDLLDQLAHAVAGGGHNLDPKRLAHCVVSDAVANVGPAGLDEQPLRRLRLERVFPHIIRVHQIQRMDARIGHGLLAFEQAGADRLPVDGVKQRASYPHILQNGIVQH